MKQKQTNKYIKLWLPVIGFHALHQLEESIGFFQWYIDYFDKIPNWLHALSLRNAELAVARPEYFVFASVAQIVFVSVIAYIFRRNENITKILIVLYLLGLSFFMIWHILSSYAVHSYAPIMVTTLAGLYLIPYWMRKLFYLNKPDAVLSE